jgi:hypothetical protein
MRIEEFGTSDPASPRPWVQRVEPSRARTAVSPNCCETKTESAASTGAGAATDTPPGNPPLLGTSHALASSAHAAHIAQSQRAICRRWRPRSRDMAWNLPRPQSRSVDIGGSPTIRRARRASHTRCNPEPMRAERINPTSPCQAASSSAGGRVAGRHWPPPRHRSHGRWRRNPSIGANIASDSHSSWHPELRLGVVRAIPWALPIPFG